MRGIEIVGCNPKNLGDILMLEAAVAKVRQIFPTIEVAVRRRSLLGKVTPGVSLKYLPLIRPTGRKKWVKNYFNRAILSPASNVFSPLTGYARASDVESVFDVCGYKYGGIWGRTSIDLDLSTYRSVKERGGRVVLLPKTYGPFANTSTKRQMAELAKLVDLCIARDEVSQNHLIDAGVPKDQCPTFPDFTASISGVHLPCYEGLRDVALVIPNVRMVDAKIGLTEEKYHAILLGLLEVAKKVGLKSAVLVHDLGKDADYAAHLARAARVPLVRDDRATVIKGIIGNAALVYSDRLHGLINALSQGVPVLTSGWTYKYAEVLKAYGMDACQVPAPLRTPVGVSDHWQSVWENRVNIKTDLRKAVMNVGLQNEAMWDRVANVLKNR
jgi:polysaccharide pyruvyl transferase WcaK-like protein